MLVVALDFKNLRISMCSWSRIIQSSWLVLLQHMEILGVKERGFEQECNREVSFPNEILLSLTWEFTQTSTSPHLSMYKNPY